MDQLAPSPVELRRQAAMLRQFDGRTDIRIILRRLRHARRLEYSAMVRERLEHAKPNRGCILTPAEHRARAAMLREYDPDADLSENLKNAKLAAQHEMIAAAIERRSRL
jgi:hypothetical protein